ncbi:hypothetical protein [Streptomyces purpureus]|uniref:Uncharacterized protein n=1 Tax=Streptomyces purpureus TaxID=1951 RepID=A0A918H624_9ACTN|nr:hypothetical protein [Streptomyces purpureus]GGT41575.1 hypothetical protein GCM10014713_39160 [Streptomyces purpureus]
MNHVPALWAAAYGSARPAPVRFLARRALALRAFVRELALADHHPFAGY